MAYVPTYVPTLRLVKNSELEWAELDNNFKLVVDEFGVIKAEADVLDARIATLEALAGVSGFIPSVLSDLTDVATVTPTAQQVLTWNGTSWSPSNPIGKTVTVTFDSGSGNLTTALSGSTAVVTNLDGRYARTVNGVAPDASGNIPISITATRTGTLAARPTTSTNGLVYVVSGDSAANNGKASIYVTGSGWFDITTADMSVNDARYVNVAGDTMTGSLILSGAPTVDLQAATKKYVDDETLARIAGDALKQPIDATLTALAALDSTTGFIVQTAADTFAKRSLVAGSGVSITNPAGIAGNVTLSVSGLTTTNFDAATLVTAAETIAANNNDTTIPTSAAVAAAIASMASGTDVNMQFFTSSGTYTPSAGFTKAIAIVTGGGGGGDGSSSTTKSSGSGGAGATVIGVINISSGAALPVTIGAGGGSSSTGPTAGSSTSLGTLISASGAQVGGLGGTTGSGGLVIPGGDGSSIEMSNGGASFWGSGGKGDSTASQGRAYGSGGGSPDQPSSGSRSAGSGASGVVLILEFK